MSIQHNFKIGQNVAVRGVISDHSMISDHSGDHPSYQVRTNDGEAVWVDEDQIIPFIPKQPDEVDLVFDKHGTIWFRNEGGWEEEDESSDNPGPLISWMELWEKYGPVVAYAEVSL